ncbi:phage portal protein family protein [Alistipes putredinis]|uniref:phage portal protein family protein n=1 Tax=Alistipes putredinis TaxID=28117 RepID=UPI003AB5AE96
MGKNKTARKAVADFESRTYESLMAAARAAKTIEQKRSVLIQLNEVAAHLTQKDIATWRSAWQMALNIENPKRGRLYDCYTDALIDLHLTGCIGQRDGKTLQKKFVLKTEDGKEDDAAMKIFERQWFADFVSYVLESRYWGHSLIQLGDVTTVNGVRTFTDVWLVPRKHVIQEYGVLVRDAGDDPRQGVSYRTGGLEKWCVEVGKPRDLGLLLKCVPQAFSKKNMLAYWDVFGEIFGMPIRIAKTAAQTGSERSRIESMLANMGAAAWGLFPDGTDIDIKESSRGDAFNVYDKRIDRANSEMSKGVLNQTMTIDSGSSLSQSEVHLEVFGNVCAADATMVKNIVNDKLIPLMIEHGFPLQGLIFDWDEAASFSPAERREMERVVLQYYDVDPQYFIDRYKIPITAKRADGFFE